MIAFHGKPEIKEAVLTQLRAHYAADEIINGVYWEKGKGCAIGCTIHSNNHAEYETRFGIPRSLARLEDGLFEALYKIEPVRAKEWPIQFMEVIPVGADLSMVSLQFLHWLLIDPQQGVIRFANKQGHKAIQRVANLYARQINGIEVSIEDWRAAYVYAAGAADPAAYAAAYAANVAADYAAYAANVAADYAATAANVVADYAADAASVANVARTNQAEKLLDLLTNAPIIKVA